MQRTTKIVATLGPASSSLDVLTRMLAAGVDVMRLNFSHGTADDHQQRATLVLNAAHSIGREVAIMADLQGPKIRVGKFALGKVTLKSGQTFVLDADRELGDEEGVGLDYKELPRDVAPGAVLLLDDGLIRLRVESVRGNEIVTRVEVGNATVPGLQKRMIRLARERNKLTITATQMMESMIYNPVPTRAEVSDVANAVLDGTDAVMLSAETAAGRFPVETIEAMSQICAEAEKSYEIELDRDFLNRTFTRIDQSIAMGALFTAFHLQVKAIASLTQSGSTALWMSRHNCGCPIFALTPEVSSQRKMSLYRNVQPLYLEQADDSEAVLRAAEDLLLTRGQVQRGDLIVLTIGEHMGKSGGTNAMKIVRVGEHR